MGTTETDRRTDGESNKRLTANTHRLPGEARRTPLRPRARCNDSVGKRDGTMAGVAVRDGEDSNRFKLSFIS